MTMVPADNLSKQQQHHRRRRRHRHRHLLYSGYGGCGGGLMSRIQGYDYSGSEAACLGSDLGVDVAVDNKSMAEDESRTNSLNEAASSSKENQEEDHQRDERWLQLGIGTPTTSHDIKHGDHHQVDPTEVARSRGGLIELDLLHGGGSSQQARPSTITTTNFHMGPEFRPPPQPLMNITGGTGHSTSLFFQQGSSSTFPHHQEINWAFRPVPPNMALPSSSSSSYSSLMQFGSCFARPLHAHTGIDVAGPSSDFRVIDPPRRPHSGIWFMLLASQNQPKEPFLPQISKSYLRIKDGRMTVRLLMKYLANKLRLDSESEIEIRCRGQELLPFLTLQHVRDNIWSPRGALTLLPHSSTASDHLMLLHYARTA